MPPASGVWPRNKAYFWQQAPFFRLLLPMAGGIFVYDRLGGPAGILNGKIAFAGAVVLFFCWLLLQNFLQQKSIIVWTRFVCLNLFFFLAGWLSAFYSDVRQQPDWYGRNLTDSSFVLARVLAPPRDLAKTQKLELQVIGRHREGQTFDPVTGKAFLLVYKKEQKQRFQRGDTLLFPARWQEISNSSNPFSFDYARFCQRKGICHQRFAGGQEIALAGSAQTDGSSWLWQVNDYCARQLKKYLKDQEAFGLLQAMILGNEQDFDPELRQAYADTGVVHIVSISGSHTAMLFLVVTWLFFWLRRPRWQWLKYAVGVALVWTYVLVAGAPPSALRSAVMFTVFALSFMAGQQQQPLNTLLMAAFVLLLTNPMFLFAIGFQLSFTAVLSLIIFYHPVYRLWPQQTWIGRRLWQLTAGSLAVEILIAPLVAYYFHNFPLLVLPANIAAMVLLGIIALIGGLAILAFSWWPFAAGFLGSVVSLSVTGFNRMIVAMQSWSPPAMKQLQISLPELILTYVAILFLAVFFLKKKKQALFAGLSFTILLLCLLLKDQYTELRQQRLIVYQISNHALADVIYGKRFISLGKDTIGSGQRVVAAARTGFGAWRHATGDLPAAFIFKGKKMLFWQEKFLPDSIGQVDVLLLGDSLKHFTLAGIRRAFAPGKIIVTGPQSRWLSRQWADSAAVSHQPFHSTLLDGAFVME